MPSKLPVRRKRKHPFNDLYGLKGSWRKQYKENWNRKYKNMSPGTIQMWQLFAENDIDGWGLNARRTFLKNRINSWVSKHHHRRNADKAHFREHMRRKYPREIVSNIAKWFKAPR